MTTTDSRPTLPPGLYLQVYRAKVPGATHAARMLVLESRVREWAALGAKGVAWHGFSTELTIDALRDLTALCRKYGLLSLAAFGMDASDPVGKAHRIGAVLVSDVCDGVILDAEGAFEVKAGTAAAAAFRDAFLPYRRQVPHKPVCDQPFPVPVRVRGQGGHGSFPEIEFAECVDARAPQFYVNDWSGMWGPRRYPLCLALFNDSWAAENAQLDAAHVRPLWATIQGYGYEDIADYLPTDLGRSLTVPTFVWCEPFPSAHFMATWREWAGRDVGPQCAA